MGRSSVSHPNVQAKHATYILAQARRQGATRIEATREAEEAWLAEMQDKAKIAERFYAECTPGYYNNEGKLGNPNGLFAGTYGAGPIKFFSILDEWRSTGRLEGVELT